MVEEKLVPYKWALDGNNTKGDCIPLHVFLWSKHDITELALLGKPVLKTRFLHSVSPVRSNTSPAVDDSRKTKFSLMALYAL